MTIYRTSGIVQGNEPYGRRVFCITVEGRRLFAFTLKGEYPMPTSKANRIQLRCQNTACPSARSGGRILLETAASGTITFKECKSCGNTTHVGMWVSLVCPSCGSVRLNNDAQMFDGIGQVVQDSVEREADRLREKIKDRASDGRGSTLRRVV